MVSLVIQRRCDDKINKVPNFHHDYAGTNHKTGTKFKDGTNFKDGTSFKYCTNFKDVTTDLVVTDWNHL